VIIYGNTNIEDNVSEYAPPPGCKYESVNIRGNVAYVAIEFPIEKKQFLYCGKLGKELTTENGYKAAELCAMNILRQINRRVGFENITGLNHIDVYYQACENWDHAAVVADGASDFFNRVLGPAGRHTRSILGITTFPKKFSVGITASFTMNGNFCCFENFLTQ
jgi:enamine deaminase RidA (YjgF/YER057c/UK114 family)